VELQMPLRVVTPTLDGEVLAAFALVDASFTVGQLGRVVAASDAGLRKVVRRLVAQGIVLHANHGHLSTYTLNRDHLAAGPIIALAQLKSRLLDAMEAALDQWADRPAYGAVFGSAGRGDMTTSSDIDVFLVQARGADPDAWDGQVEEFSRLVHAWTGNDVRVLTFNEGELTAREPVVRDVLAEGLTIYGTSSWLRRRLGEGASE